MASTSAFRAGPDPRRNISRGRGCTGKTIAATIRRTLGSDAQRLCEQIKALAVAGDGDAVLAAAVLLASVAQPTHAPNFGRVSAESGAIEPIAPAGAAP